MWQTIKTILKADAKLICEILFMGLAHQGEAVRTDKERIEELEQIHFLMHLFFVKNHPELIPKFVEMAYQEIPDEAIEAVTSLHDETFDLSTLECTGNDFKPW